MKEDIEDLLMKKGYYPLTSPLWNSFEFKQIKPNDDQEKQINIQKIKSNVGNNKGIYVYDIDGEKLYLGKGSPIKERLISHYKKLLKVNSDNSRVTFFQDNQGIVKIFWLEIKNKEERQLVEHLLSFVLQPKYKKWRAI